MKGFRTVVINAVAVLVPVVGFLVDNQAIVASISGPAAPLWIAGLGAINLGLRAITTTRMFSKE